MSRNCMISMQKAALTRFCVGASSRDLRLTGLLEWQAAQPLPVHFTAASTLKQVMTHPVGAAIIKPSCSVWPQLQGSATGKKGR